MSHQPDDSELAALARDAEMHLDKSGLDRAREAIDRATRNGDLASLHICLGDLYRERKLVEPARTRYRAALSLDPARATAHDGLGRIANNLNDLPAADRHFRDAIRLSPEIAAFHQHLGHVHMRAGQPGAARCCFEQALKLDGDNAGAFRGLATVAMQQGEPETAVEYLQQCLRLAPGDPLAWVNLGIVQHTLGDLVAAERAYERALQHTPNDADIHINLGLVRQEQLDMDGALRALRHAVTLAPDNPRARIELAAILEDGNQLDDARVQLGHALKICPSDPRTLLEAAKLRRRDRDIDGALNLLNQIDLDRVDHRIGQYAHYELGLCHDRQKDAARAFPHFIKANELGRKNERLRRTDPERYIGLVRRIRRFFERVDVSSWSAAPPPANRRLGFIYGFPRSGTTLLDVALDGHPDIQSVEEKPTITPVVMALQELAEGYPDSLARLQDGQLASLRDIYFQELDRVSTRDGRLALDKMPIRTAHAGLLWRLFPDAPVLFVVRHPCDVCLSSFMQQFNASDIFANCASLEGTVRLYDEVMTTWQVYADRLNIRYRMIRYEDLVEDLERVVRGALTHLDLGWHPDVLKYQRTALGRGRIATNSYHQVTEKIYSRAKMRWLRYRRFFEPHRDVLNRHIAYFGYDSETPSL